MILVEFVIFGEFTILGIYVDFFAYESKRNVSYLHFRCEVLKTSFQPLHDYDTQTFDRTNMLF